MPTQPITSWMPYFDSSGNFMECTGWDAVLKDIFTVLVTRPGTRQWQPKFGCKLLDILFEVNVESSTIVNAVKEAFHWLPHVKLIDVTCEINPMSNGRGNQASVHLSVMYDGETREVKFQIPQIDLLNGSIHNIGVRR